MRIEAREFWISNEAEQKSQASVSPFDHRGQTITPQVLSAAEEISRRAIRHAERLSVDPAVAVNLLEEAAAAVSRALRFRSGNETPVRDLEAYLFRAFLRCLNRTKKRDMRLAEAIASSGRISPQSLEPRITLDKKILLDEFLMHCDEATRDMLCRRVAGFSWKEIAIAYQVSSHAAESRFGQALQRVRRKLGLE
jgi:DNA-directed RNA polymerase specialized sigma24 family protein